MKCAALNRGYGMSRYRWPMHCGLLNNDCRWVMDTKFARGVYHSDILPPVDLGNNEVVPTTTLDLSLMELGESQSGASWLARVLSLRDNAALGPFRLSFLETILSVADWRGSEVT